MSDIAIRVESLSKRYKIGAARGAHDTLRERVAAGLQSVFSPHGRSQSTANTIWALNGVSFDVKHSEVVGIIGQNGAGKSTLLKILSRITPPTGGRAEIHGRVGSLLEVGTGFDRDLTGRENTYLNGAILGMRKAEIDRKFDDIVAFAEVEKFIDTPVKRYSSGMYVRLAFAVAAHLEPEILIVDEVLAVGDVRFQEKCLDKMGELRQSGRTVLFVSHNMSAITRLCPRTLLVQDGKLKADGPSEQVVSSYLTVHAATSGAREWSDPSEAPQGSVARLCAVRVRNEEGWMIDTVDIRQAVGIEMEYEVLEEGHVLMPNFWFDNDKGMGLFSAPEVDPDWRRRPRPTGRFVSTAWIPGNFLTEGKVLVNAAMCTLYPTVLQFGVPRVVSFQVTEGPELGLARGDWPGPIGGAVRPLLKWTTRFSPHATIAGTDPTDALRS
jgi:homopolymeric O-antigen transport system ATP-binding protein